MLDIRVELLRSSAAFVKNWVQIEALRSSCGALGDVLLDPVHVLAASSEERPPCCCACWHGDSLIGLLYANDQHVFGISAGYAVAGDYSGRGLLICQPEYEEVVLKASVDALFRAGIHSLHLRMRPRAALATTFERYAVTVMGGVVPGGSLQLQDDYDSLLGTLGKHTRRNIRYYTRKTIEQGISFVPLLEVGEYEESVARLSAKTSFAPSRHHLERDARVTALHAGGQRFALRAADGTCIAVLCGFTVGAHFHVLTQLNDPEFEKLSLSIVLRGYVLEYLIELGYEDVQFLGGTSLTLGRSCTPVSYCSIFLDKRSGLAAVVKRLLTTYCKRQWSTGKTVSGTLEAMCGQMLGEERLHARTALLPASVAFPKKEAEELMVMRGPVMAAPQGL